MKIIQSQIQMQSQHIFQHEENRQESLRVWKGDERPRFEDVPPAAIATPQAEADRVSLSDAAKRRYLLQSTPSQPQDELAAIQPGEDPKLMAMRLILEVLTGKKINVASLDEAQPESTPTLTPQPPSAAPSPAQPRSGWGMEYDSRHTIVEHEEMQFSAAGEVTTEAGEQLEIAVSLAMSRDYVETRELHLRAGDAVLVDPLVINFADQPPGLSEEKFAFDLDRDGANEQISFVTPGSGFLFLDRNNDGQATDGTELFGPASGSGFAELAALDADGNGWLDDNDPMFAKLQVWVKDAVGSDYFAALKDLNIGAIMLSHQATPFSLTSQQNTQLGQVTDSGLFLREDGSAGSVQEISLAV